MSDRATLEKVKEQANQLSWHDQLKLVSYISDQLSNIDFDKDENDDFLRKQRERSIPNIRKV